MMCIIIISSADNNISSADNRSAQTEASIIEQKQHV